MTNVMTNDFTELTNDELNIIDGGEGYSAGYMIGKWCRFWSNVGEDIYDFVHSNN